MTQTITTPRDRHHAEQMQRAMRWGQIKPSQWGQKWLTFPGMALLDAVTTWARDQGASAVILSVRRTNKRAYRLYHRAGFCRTLEAADDPEEEIMTKPLGAVERDMNDQGPSGVGPRDDHLRGELLRMLECDQLAARASYEASQGYEPHCGRFLFDIPQDEWLSEYWEVTRTVEAHVERLRDMVGRVGWPGRSVVGHDGARAAWVLAQHAGQADAIFQQSLVPLLVDAVVRDDADAEHLAALVDRVELQAGRLQIYGTHLAPDGDKWKVLRGLVEPGEVDRRRRDIGLKPWSEYLDDCLHGRLNP